MISPKPFKRGAKNPKFDDSYTKLIFFEILLFFLRHRKATQKNLQSRPSQRPPKTLPDEPPETTQSAFFCALSLYLSLFPALCSLLPVLCSLLPVLCSLLPALCSLLSAPCSLLSALCSMLSVPCSLLPALGSLFFALCSLLPAMGS